MMELIQVVTTAGSRDEAGAIARGLVERRLAACVQISGPISSTYWWQDQIESSEEWLCTVKTQRALYEHVEATIRQLHSYDEPEILATAVVAASRGYADWLSQETRLPPD